MSLGEEIMTEARIEQYLAYEWERKKVSDGLWKDRWGNEINVTDMTVDHIQNCIRMLRKRDDEISWAWVKRFEGELGRRSA